MNNSDLSGTSSHGTDLQVLHHERLKHNKNAIIGYLNINSLRNKLTDRNKFVGGLIEYVRKGLTCNRTAKYEPKSNECACSEITFSKKK